MHSNFFPSEEVPCKSHKGLIGPSASVVFQSTCFSVLYLPGPLAWEENSVGRLEDSRQFAQRLFPTIQ